jgi:hypothetical protein
MHLFWDRRIRKAFEYEIPFPLVETARPCRTMSQAHYQQIHTYGLANMRTASFCIDNRSNVIAPSV